MTELELKAKFAEELLKTPNDAFAAARAIFGQNARETLWAANFWPVDKEVIRIKAELIEKRGATAFLPDKAATARKIWDAAQNAKSIDDQLKGMKLYAEVMGFLIKAEPVTNVNVDVSNRVMVVKDHGTVQEWEAKLQAQQRLLLEQTAEDV